MNIQNPLEQFQIVQIIPIKAGAIDISFTNSSLMMILATGAFINVCRVVLVEGQGHLVPNRWQALIEFFYGFIQDMVSSNLGDRGKGYFPMIFVLFIFLLTCNLIGMVPYSFTVTSHIIVTLIMALFIFVAVTVIGFMKHGFKYLSIFVPSGVPAVLLPLITIIEIISYLSRPVSLSVRLFANMMAGHTMLKVFGGFVISLGILGGWLPLSFSVALTGLEILVAFLQAYVFAILTCIYLNDALNLHH